MKTTVVQYKLEEAENARIEYAKRGTSLFIQYFPRRPISPEEGKRKDDDGPTKKIINALDRVLPKKNAAVNKETYVNIYPPKEDIPQYTIEVEGFYEFPTDCDYMRGKIIEELKRVKL